MKISDDNLIPLAVIIATALVVIVSITVTGEIP
mgnify:CR=1 FL=1